jgi:hypothetical protein
MHIAGTPVPQQAVLFFAGALPVRLDTPNLELGEHVVHLNGSVPGAIGPSVSPAGKQAVGDAIAAAVSRCARGQAPGYCRLLIDQRVVPGSLRGTIDHDDLRIAVEKNPKKLPPRLGALVIYGLLHVTGTVTVTGSYQRLDFDNLPVRKSGTLKLSIDAHCYATDPTKVAWGSTA